MRHILSFDIAKDKSVYCFIDELRNVIIDATLIEHKKDEFDLLFNKVKNHSNLIVIMESTSIYHKLTLSFNLKIAYMLTRAKIAIKISTKLHTKVDELTPPINNITQVNIFNINIILKFELNNFKLLSP